MYSPITELRCPVFIHIKAAHPYRFNKGLTILKWECLTLGGPERIRTADLFRDREAC